MKTVAVSGYFLFPHVGHVRLFQAARALGDRLILEVVRSIRYVDDVVLSIDTDRTVCKTLELLRADIFANGGDRSSDEIPEAEVCRRLGILMVDGVGGGKLDSSSRILSVIRQAIWE